MQGLLFSEMRVLGSYSIRQIIDHDLQIVVLPNGRQLDRAFDDIELPTDPRHQIATHMEDFRKMVAERYFDIMRHLCQNRCRTRRLLCHAIQDWEMAQMDAEDIDSLLQLALEDEPLKMESGGVLQPLPLSSWCFFYKIRQMEWIVQLGFELDIYQSDELVSMYWYLMYLTKEKQRHTMRISTFIDRAFYKAGGIKDFRRPTGSSSHSGSSGMDGKYDLKHGSLSAVEFRFFSRSMEFAQIASLEAACTWEFADGLSCLYTVLARLKILPLPGYSSSAAPPQSTPSSRSNDLHRYEIRMKPFAPVGHPRLPSFDEFQHATARPEMGMTSMLIYAETAISGARKNFEVLSKKTDAESFSMSCHERWVADAKACLKATIAAGVALNVLKKNLTTARAYAAGTGGLEDSTLVDPDGTKWPDMTKRLKVEIPAADKGYHSWWVVPKVIPIG